MTQKFYKKDIQKIFTDYLAAQGYSVNNFSYDTSSFDLNSITCEVVKSQPTKTFIIPVGHLTAEQAKKNVAELMQHYREEITITEDTILPKIEVEKRNEN